MKKKEPEISVCKWNGACPYFSFAVVLKVGRHLNAVIIPRTGEAMQLVDGRFREMYSMETGCTEQEMDEKFGKGCPRFLREQVEQLLALELL